MSKFQTFCVLNCSWKQFVFYPIQVLSWIFIILLNIVVKSESLKESASSWKEKKFLHIFLSRFYLKWFIERTISQIWRIDINHRPIPNILENSLILFCPSAEILFFVFSSLWINHRFVLLFGQVEDLYFSFKGCYSFPEIKDTVKLNCFTFNLLHLGSRCWRRSFSTNEYFT